ncbi:hypothetical protein [Neomoorella mulderi]|uniref:Uncharacterized protein n=1 Tax=Moorella mulderi DSM 14980 TaxID=1122241 RepID=A0A151AT93_9FIRM|nr:hypothetical protein [Moorella mulderi]KYH30825.1 hypothetical protein MOMUL_28900 [Moorella mulderi DSM 14980]
MRTVDYDQYMEQLRKKSLHLYTRWAAGQKDNALLSRKSRDLEEDKVLFLLDWKRWQEALTSGRIEKIGPRRYRWNG